jgi:hypothetical protein
LRLGWWWRTVGRLLRFGFWLVRLFNWRWPGLVLWRWWRWWWSLLWSRLVRGLLWWRWAGRWRRRLVLRLLRRRWARSLRPARDNNGARLHPDREGHWDWFLRLRRRRIVLSGDWGLRGAVLVNRSSLGSSVLAGGYGCRSWRSLWGVIAVTSRSGSWSWSSVISVVMVVATSSISVLGLGEHFRDMALFCDLVILESKVYSVIGDINIDAITGHGNAFDY